MTPRLYAIAGNWVALGSVNLYGAPALRWRNGNSAAVSARRWASLATTTPVTLETCAPLGLQLDATQVSYFLSREKVVSDVAGRRLSRWRDGVFAAMARNAGSVSDFFNIPTNRVVELGTRIEL